MDLVIPGICQVCSKPMDAAVPLVMRCRCRGIKMGKRLIPMPKGGLTIRKGKVRGIPPAKRLAQKRAKEFLAKGKAADA